jgi:hypothetical protein
MSAAPLLLKRQWWGFLYNQILSQTVIVGLPNILRGRQREDKGKDNGKVHLIIAPKERRAKERLRNKYGVG